MALANYTDLQAAMTNWLNRSDLSSRIPEFIALAEADIRRQLRDKKTTAALTLDADVATKTVGGLVKELVSLRYNTSTRKYALVEMTHTALANVRGTASGAPRYYAFSDGILYFDVTPDSTYVMEITYIEKILALSGGSPTNYTLTNSPDIYLYGSLMQAAPFLEHDERVGLWEKMYTQAVERENIYRERLELGATPVMQLPVVFGEEI